MKVNKGKKASKHGNAIKMQARINMKMKIKQQ